jgi:hypothetical protein
VVDNLKTAYQVGRGMIGGEEEVDDDDAEVALVAEPVDEELEEPLGGVEDSEESNEREV